MDQRQQALENWLTVDCGLSHFQLTPMAGDASFRRYFRLQQAEGSYVVMDAPPARENCQSFVAIASTLKEKNLCVPEIFASDLQQGFLLVTDFGDRLYLNELNDANANELYGIALDSLAVLQNCRSVKGLQLPQFNADFIYHELQVFKEWFLLKHLNLDLPAQTEQMLADFFYFLANSAATQPQVFMHRDYHSANLMYVADKQVGILDFQDAFIGPVTYDLVSLLRDCYIDWPEQIVQGWVLQYKEKIGSAAPVSDEIFLRWFDLMGVQRHLKALLTFSRKFHRDASQHYLQFIPRTLNYVASVCPRYEEAAAFNEFLTKIILPQLQKVSLCEQ
jgi:aminoglycoside/choline kinase family phosphotransferase